MSDHDCTGYGCRACQDREDAAKCASCGGDPMLCNCASHLAEIDRLTTALRASTASESRLRGALEVIAQDGEIDAVGALARKRVARAALLPEGTPGDGEGGLMAPHANKMLDG